ncbi:hypothetical protein GGR50DRAFT_239424 [Xylaria sp. CBS 124048]|nr:hypothetical protein GGR50DRAFT_239424 [Xylaria sp. CBS 124048]
MALALIILMNLHRQCDAAYRSYLCINEDALSIDGLFVVICSASSLISPFPCSLLLASSVPFVSNEALCLHIHPLNLTRRYLEVLAVFLSPLQHL